MEQRYYFFKFLTKLMISFFIGISISFISIQRDENFRSLVNQKLKNSLSISLKCSVDCNVRNINLFIPKITLEYLKVWDEEKSFFWRCDGLDISFSWIDFMLGGMIDIYIDIDKAKINSLLLQNNRDFQLSVWPSIAALFEGSSDQVPTILKSLSVKRGEILIKNNLLGHVGKLTLSSTTKNIYGNYKTKLSFFDGLLKAYSKNIFERLFGSVSFDISKKTGKLNFSLDGKCLANLQFLGGSKTCFISGKWAEDKGDFELNSQDKSLIVSPIKFYFNNNNFMLDLGLYGGFSDLYDILLSKKTDFKGKCSGNLLVCFGQEDTSFSGKAKLEDFKYKDIEIFSLLEADLKNNMVQEKEAQDNIEPLNNGEFAKNILEQEKRVLEKKDDIIGGGVQHCGTLKIIRGSKELVPELENFSLSGDFCFDLSGGFKCSLVNDTEVKLPFLQYWKVDPKKIKLSLETSFESNSGKKEKSHNLGVDKTGSTGLTGNIDFLANNNAIRTSLDISGNLSISDNTFNLKGKVGDKKYYLDLNLLPDFNLKNFTYKNSDGKLLLEFKANNSDGNKFSGALKFPLIKEIVSNNFGYELVGDGNLNFYGMKDGKDIFLDLNFDNGSVSFPGLYNFLNNFKIVCKADLDKKIFVASSSVINFHKGFVTSKNAVIKFDKYFNPVSFYAPFIFNNCFVNIKNDIFSLVSGRMLLSKTKAENANLAGLLMLERSHVKKNIFAQGERKKYFKESSGYSNNFLQDLHCDISVITKDPVRITTDFLNTSANLDLSIKNKIFDPQLSGKIDLTSGTLAFPYKPLNITKGSIYFLQHQSFDPIIEIVASNKINKYNVSMYISGSLQNYNISFESSPALSEEQIIALLIAGSAQESLNVVAPAIIIQSLKDSLFGSNDSDPGKKNYFGKILNPFKNVRLVPSFTDQTGRGGLRGSLEVDINERARAAVEKNFSLSEDTRFEIEYLLADDVAIRGVRRENGDLGGEVEMRWKF